MFQKKKKILVILVIFCLIIFSIFYYKNRKNGNNISNKEKEEIIEYILNDVNDYTANIEVTVFSNKNKNVYKMIQEVEGNTSIQEILSPENIKGLKIEFWEHNLKVSNLKLNLEKQYDDYYLIQNNALFFNVFIQDYKKEDNISEYREENGEIILETKLENNPSTYVKYKELYINEETKQITKLIVRDNTKTARICIKYNDIEIK